MSIRWPTPEEDQQLIAILTKQNSEQDQALIECRKQLAGRDTLLTTMAQALRTIIDLNENDQSYDVRTAADEALAAYDQHTKGSE